jgi:hypothetical protein
LPSAHDAAFGAKVLDRVFVVPGAVNALGPCCWSVRRQASAAATEMFDWHEDVILIRARQAEDLPPEGS